MTNTPFYANQTTHWYERDVTALPSEALETELGRVTITLHEDATVVWQYSQPVRVHRIWYEAAGRAGIRYDENVYCAAYLHRVGFHEDDGTPYRDINAPDATDNARHKVSTIIKAVVEPWLERNGSVLYEAAVVEDKNRLQRARNKLAQWRAEIAQRERWLDEAEARMGIGRLAANDREMLKDLWSSKWQLR